MAFFADQANATKSAVAESHSGELEEVLVVAGSRSPGEGVRCLREQGAHILGGGSNG